MPSRCAHLAFKSVVHKGRVIAAVDREAGVEPLERVACAQGGPALACDPAQANDPAGRRADATDPAASLPAGLPSIADIWRAPLPHFTERGTDVILCRTAMTLVRPWILSVRGLHNLAPEHDPFILAVNHSQRPEAVALPTLAIFARGGKLIHFMADWPFLMVPFVGLLFRRGGTINVGNKSARPAWLNRFRRALVSSRPALEQAERLVAAGEPVGIFPEGTVNRNPARLLAGRHGAARLSLSTGVPVVPAGISFPRRKPGRVTGDLMRLAIEIGPALHPSPLPAGSRASRDAVGRWHRVVMASIATLSGKTWTAAGTGGQ